jgi:DNA/RNA-binding domain of Phe-tRNA-synthetase-like protein
MEIGPQRLVLIRSGSMHTIALQPHPLLDAGAFITEFAAPLSAVPVAAIAQLLALTAPAPVSSDDSVRAAIRQLLRIGGYKPTGRGKPASEYLLRAATEGTLGTINAAVDACNVASLHSGLPVSVVDLDVVTAPLRIEIAAPGTRYVFNPAGQEIDLGGLVSLFDAGGACANAVKDSQRTKTHGLTRRTLSIVWGSRVLGDRTARTTAWYRELLGSVGATTEDAALTSEGR